MFRLMASVLVVCFVFVSTLAQAAPSSYVQNADTPSIQQMENSTLPLENSAKTSLDAKLPDQASAVDEDCPCKKHHGKMASIVCGVVLSLSEHPTVLAAPIAVSVRYEWSSDDMLDAYTKTLKRPPRTIL